MALHSPKYNVKNETWQAQDKNRFSHLSRMIAPALQSKFAARAPEMNGGTTIVILPYPFEDDGNLLPNGAVNEDRLDSNPENPRCYNRWLFKASDRGVLRFGHGHLSMLFDNPDDDSGWNFDDDHPLQLIYRSVAQVVNDKRRTVAETPYGTSVSDNWKLLLSGEEGKSYPVIKSPEVLYAVFALVYRSGKDDFAGSGPPLGAAATDPIPVFIMTKGTAASLMDEIDKPASNVRLSDGLLHPQFTGCKFIHFYNKQEGTCAAVRAAAATGAGAGDADGFGTRRAAPAHAGEKVNVGFGYGVGVTNTCDGTKNGKTVSRDACARLAVKRLQPWERVLRGVTPEECAELIQQHAKLPLSVLAYAWQNRPEFFTETTKSLMAQKVTSFGSPAAPAHGSGRVSEFDELSAPATNAPAGGMDWDRVEPNQGTEPEPLVPPPSVPDATEQTAPGATVSASERFRKAMRTSGAVTTGVPSQPSVPNPPTFRKPG